ncbi:MAG: iron-sulfur cluster assembly accessory protein [Verrucomicrobiota bacterium]
MSSNATIQPPADVRVGDERLVKLTNAAGKKITSLLEREDGKSYLRIAITGGGCNGLSYKTKFVGAPKKSDILVPTGGVSVVVDMKSALYLKGTEMDFSDKMVGGGFKFSNPNAKSSCSCGESFSV